MLSQLGTNRELWIGALMDTFEVASVGYDGTVYIFPACEDGSVPIVAATGSGSAVRIILDREGVKKLAMRLSEESIISEPETASPSR